MRVPVSGTPATPAVVWGRGGRPSSACLGHPACVSMRAKPQRLALALYASPEARQRPFLFLAMSSGCHHARGPPAGHHFIIESDEQMRPILTAAKAGPYVSADRPTVQPTKPLVRTSPT